MRNSSQYPSSKVLRIYGDDYSINLRQIRSVAVGHMADHDDRCTLEELSRDIGITRQSLWALWSGKNVSEYTLFATLKALGLQFGSVATLTTEGEKLAEIA